jgi:hypothetical protein
MLREAQQPEKQIKEKLRVKMTGGRREIARARIDVPGHGKTDMVLMQDPPYYLIWRWDKQKHVLKSRDAAKVLKYWAQTMKKFKGKLLPKEELQRLQHVQAKARFAKFVIAAMTGVDYKCDGPVLVQAIFTKLDDSGQKILKEAYHWIQAGRLKELQEEGITKGNIFVSAAAPSPKEIKKALSKTYGVVNVFKKGPNVHVVLEKSYAGDTKTTSKIHKQVKDMGVPNVVVYWKRD